MGLLVSAAHCLYSSGKKKHVMSLFPRLLLLKWKLFFLRESSAVL